MNPIIRLARSSDLGEILDLITPFRGPAFNWSEDLFRTEFAFAKTWILQDEEGISAFCCLRDAGDAWEISVLATRQDRQQQGCMKKLLGEIVAMRSQERHLWLEVHEKNTGAQKLYEKLGFQKSGARGGYYSDGSTAFLYSLTKRT
jgi:ribosomal protein S18 acetylase RimI-like enzyme